MDTNNQSFKLTGTLKKILFYNEENKYYIAVLENDQAICGQYFDTDLAKLVGEEIIITGVWNTHKKYGVQFVFTSLELKEAEIMRERIQTLDLMQNYIGDYYSKEWVMKNVLMFTDEDIEKMADQSAEEQPDTDQPVGDDNE